MSDGPIRTSIPMQMDHVTDPNGFAFTLDLPAVPAVGSAVCVGGRRFRVVDVEWRPFNPFPVRLLAEEISERSS